MNEKLQHLINEKLKNLRILLQAYKDLIGGTLGTCNNYHPWFHVIIRFGIGVFVNIFIYNFFNICVQ